MNELSQAIQTAFTGMVESGQLTKIIEANVQKSVETVLSEALRSYSPFQKALAEHVQKSLSVDFSNLGLAGYNETILKIIKAKLDASIHKFADKQFAESMDELLQNPPAEIKLSALVKMLSDEAKEDDNHEGISWHLVMSDSSDGWGHLKMDAKPDVRKDDCRFEIAFTAKGEIYRIYIPYSGDVTKKIFAGPFFGFERVLFQMYAAKTKLILDEDAVES